MQKYDPFRPPVAKEWLELDESEQMALVQEQHEAAGIRLPNPLLHATIHTIAETQIAMGDELPVGRTLQRLMSEGLDRHDALHAVGMVLSEHLWGLVKAESFEGDPNPGYWSALERMTAERWRKYGEEMESEEMDSEEDDS
jgi:hypothetical protein